MNYYAGIGSRRTPSFIANMVMKPAAAHMGNLGLTLRTGGAHGADQAFLEGAKAAGQLVDLHIPWSGYNGHFNTKTDTVCQRALDAAAEYHPNWSACSSAAKKLHARNMYIILGANLDHPVDCIICWTPSGRVEGGTGQALRVAAARDIKVYNLGENDVLTLFKARLSQLRSA